ncbi:Triacylglycerol lipase 1 [Spatholobus suberectus]|nr:Triacylglycerol lipase 1 [Spatholobus suberectus]
MALVFVIGYAGIIFEQYLPFNKSGVGLLMAVSLWVIRSIGLPQASADFAARPDERASLQRPSLKVQPRRQGRSDRQLNLTVRQQLQDDARAVDVGLRGAAGEAEDWICYIFSQFSSRQLDIHHSHDFSVAAISTSVRVSEGLFVPSVISLAVPLHIWDCSWQDLAMYDLAEMINYINSVTNSKLFVLGHSQGKKSMAASTQPEIAEKVEAAALVLAKGVHQLSRKRLVDLTSSIRFATLTF